jgi:hypothetical protein
MAPETPKATESAESLLNPASFIRTAQRAHPAFRYAVVAAGLLAIVATFSKFGINYLTLVLGAIALIGLMVLFVVFAHVSQLAKSTLDLPARVFLWAILILTLGLIGLLVSSVFFNAPLPIRDLLMREFASGEPPQPQPAPATANVALMAADVLESHKAIGYQIAFMQSWNRPPTRQLLRVEGRTIIARTVSGDRSVAMEIDPDQLPQPQFYSAETVVALEAQAATAVASFFAASLQYRAAMRNLISNPADLLNALTGFQLAGEQAFERGILALCALGHTPPTLFSGGAFQEPAPPICP